MGEWQTFVERHFARNGRLRLQLVSAMDSSNKSYQVLSATLARYYHAHSRSGITHIQMMFESATVKELGNGGHVVECARSTFIYSFGSESQVCFMPYATGYR